MVENRNRFTVIKDRKMNKKARKKTRLIVKVERWMVKVTTKLCSAHYNTNRTVNGNNDISTQVRLVWQTKLVINEIRIIKKINKFFNVLIINIKLWVSDHSENNWYYYILYNNNAFGKPYMFTWAKTQVHFTSIRNVHL